MQPSIIPKASCIRLLRAFIFLLFSLVNPYPATASDNWFVEPGGIPQGGVSSFYIPGGSLKDVLLASFSGGEVLLYEDRGGVRGIVAADLEAKPEKYNLRVKAGDKEYETAISVTAGNFGEQRLNLPESAVELDAETLERAIKESALIKDIWMGPLNKPLWEGPFIMPVEGELSGSFGVRRVLNGSPREPHSGIDIAAPEGATVVASNSGLVVLASDFFFNGRLVILDHGLGLFTMYFHLSERTVKQGDVVAKGAVIGSVGMTGRATGPHLHFGARIRGARVSPYQFIKAAGNPGLSIKKTLQPAFGTGSETGLQN